MKFIPTDWGKQALIENNIKNITSNLFRIKFYYQEDCLESLNLISDFQEKQKKVLHFQEISDEVMIYVKVLAAFQNKNATIENDMDDLQAVIDYFLYMEIELLDKEIKNNIRYIEWLRNHEYY